MESTAGGSAADKARELREKAARLEEQARQWDKGAEGERRTAAVLSELSRYGYVVLDDLSIPGSRANIDHVVVGPTGVVVVETKAYTGNLQVNKGVLWHGRYPLRRELAAAAFEADKVRAVVASTGWSVLVRSVMCIHAASVPVDRDGSLAPLELCGPLNLLQVIRSAPAVLTPDHISELVRRLETSLPPRQVAPRPRPAPAQPLAVAPSTPRRSSALRSVQSPRPRREGLHPVVRVMYAIGGLFMMLVGLAVLYGIGTTAVSVVSSTTTTATSAPPSSEPPPTPGRLIVPIPKVIP